MIYFSKPSFIISCLTMFSLLASTNLFAENNLSRYEIKNLLRNKISTIIELTENPQIIEEVKQQNSKHIPLKSIKEIDKLWQSYDINHPVKKTMYASKTGSYLKSLIEFEQSIYSEIFLTDNQGANITAWPITSDYWQGDEAKWSRAFNRGQGDIFIGELEYDESSEANAIQISVPIMNEGRAIGVLIAGIKLTYLQAKYLHSRK